MLDAEAASAVATGEIIRLDAEPNRQYDYYVRLYGPLSRFSLRRTGRTDPATGQEKMARVRPPQGGFRDDPFAALVYALEVFDPVGQRAAKAAIFTHRVVAPRTPRLGADTAADALAICLDARGEARLDEIARLSGSDQADARAQLSTLVFDDPVTGRLVPAAEFPGNGRTPGTVPGSCEAWRAHTCCPRPDHRRRGPRPLRDAFQLTWLKGSEAKAGKKGQRT
ncbi:MAG TPA: hypothetical protein VFQ44_10895 [Streptosporangiaceae bacterium]|nr:hypothetical protein [Streptosporangiaceae bacterium]